MVISLRNYASVPLHVSTHSFVVMFILVAKMLILFCNNWMSNHAVHTHFSGYCAVVLRIDQMAYIEVSIRNLHTRFMF